MKTKFRNTCTPVRPGDLLLTEQPFAYVLSSKEKGIRCDNCLERGKVLKCSGCQFVHYCGRECQKDAWNDHKWECSNLKRVSPKVIPDAARMMAKIINKLNKSNGLTYQAYYTANSFRMWKDLMSHYSDLKTDKKRMDHFTSLIVVLNEFLKNTTVPNTVELMGLYGRMVINSFTILDVDMNSIGTGVYLGASIIDHSCNPNAVATFDGKTISIRATKHMDSLDWKQVRISYIDLMKTPWERQTELLETYYFLCQCDRCLDEKQLNYLHGAKCPNEKCDKPISIEWKSDCKLVIREDLKNAQNGNTEISTNGHTDKKQNGVNGVLENDIVHCNDCGTKVTERQIEVFRKAMDFTELHLQNMKGASVAYVDVCKYCLEKQRGVLHPLNVMYAQTLDHAFDAFIQLQLWKQASECAVQLLPCFKYYYGDLHPLIGLLHLKYGKILLLQNTDLQEANKQLRLSQEILKITHGELHPLYRNELIPLLADAMMAWQCNNMQ